MHAAASVAVSVRKSASRPRHTNMPMKEPNPLQPPHPTPPIPVQPATPPTSSNPLDTSFILPASDDDSHCDARSDLDGDIPRDDADSLSDPNNSGDTTRRRRLRKGEKTTTHTRISKENIQSDTRYRSQPTHLSIDATDGDSDVECASSSSPPVVAPMDRASMAARLRDLKQRANKTHGNNRIDNETKSMMDETKKANKTTTHEVTLISDSDEKDNPAGLTWRRTRRTETEMDNTIENREGRSRSSRPTIAKSKKKPTATTRRANSKKSKRKVSSSDEDDGGDDDGDSEFELESVESSSSNLSRSKKHKSAVATAAAAAAVTTSKSKNLKDHWKTHAKEERGGSASPSTSQTSTQQQRTYHLSLSQSSAQSREHKSPSSPSPTVDDTKKKKKRYRSLVDGSTDDSEIEIVDKKKPTPVRKRAKLAAPPPPRKLQLNLTDAPPSTPTAHATARTPVAKGPPSVLWIDKYAPRSEEQLCVHLKKRAEVKSWLQQFGLPPPPRIGHTHHTNVSRTTTSPVQPDGVKYGHGQSMLILAGPAGSGKSAMIRVLAATLGYAIVTWTDADTEFVHRSEDDPTAFKRHAYQPYESKMTQFRSFFSSATRYALPLSNSVDATAGGAPRDIASQVASSALVSTASAATSGGRLHPKSMVVLEDFPSPNPNLKIEFLQILRDSLPRMNHPLIFLLTTEHETKSSTHHLEKEFGLELLQHPFVNVIYTNPINDTELRRALERVIEGEHLDMKDEDLFELIDTCNGDVRHAIQALQFQSVSHTAAAGDTDHHAHAAARRPKTRRKPKKKVSVDGDGESACAAGNRTFAQRDESFSIFHSVGKILHAKPTEARAVDAIIEAADMEPIQYLEWIYANYVDHLSAPVIPKAVGFHTATGIQINTGRPPLPASSGGSSAGDSAGKPLLLSPPSFFDDDDDMDGDAFDQLMSRAAAATATPAATTTPKTQTGGLIPPHTSHPHRHDEPDSQAEYDASALGAIVEATGHFSDADILAAASNEQFGGESQSPVDPMQAAEVACRGFMLAKRGCAWVRHPPAGWSIPHKMVQMSGPLSSKLFRLQTQKRQMYHQVFLQYAEHITLELDLLMEKVQLNGRPTPKQFNMMQLLQGFNGRDFLLPSSSNFLDLLPYLHLISSASPPTNAHAPPNRYNMPPPPPQPSPYGYRPSAYGGGATSNVRPGGFGRAVPSILSSYLPPKPTQTQLLFLRNLTSYHLHTYVDKLYKQQLQAFEMLQAHIKQQAWSKPATTAMPTAEMLDQEIEEIDDRD